MAHNFKNTNRVGFAPLENATDEVGCGNKSFLSRRQRYQVVAGSLTGFTLIEVLIYIAFFVLVVGTLLGIAYQTIAGTDQVSRKMAIQQEGNFILSKINWALYGAQAVSIGPGFSKIIITRFSTPSTVSFSQNGNFVDINSGVGTLDLNSQNVIVSNLIFTEVQSLPNPPEIQASFSLSYAPGFLSKQNFQVTKYLGQ